MTSVEQFASGFAEEPGYLDFARVGPLGQTALEEDQAQTEFLRRARFGSLEASFDQDGRVREGVSGLVGFRPDQISFQPNTSMGLMHTMFGLTGVVALSLAEFPSLTFAAERASQALGRLKPLWIETDYGRVTPGTVRDQLTPETTAVAVSLVDFRTGYLADLDGIRQVIGDRLLIVDAIQGFGVVDAPYEVADVIASGGQKWARAGHDTGFLALSDRAAEQVFPVFSGWMAASEEMPLDEVLDAGRGASAFQVSNPSPRAQARFAAVLEEIGTVGVGNIRSAIADQVSRVLDLADEFAIPVVSPRALGERAGIVVLQPVEDQFTVLTASLFNHGVTVTTRAGTIRISVHVSTSEETLAMLRAAFTSYLSAISV